MAFNFDGVDDYITSSPTYTYNYNSSVGLWFIPYGTGYGMMWSTPGTYLQVTAYYETFTFQMSAWSGAGLGWQATEDTDPDLTEPGKWHWLMFTAKDTDIVDPYPPAALYTMTGSTFRTRTVENGGLTNYNPGGVWGGQTTLDGTVMLSNSYWIAPYQIAEYVVYQRALSEAEARAVAFLGVNAVPDYSHYVPGDRDLQTFGSINGTWSNTGATLVPHPPTRPAGRRG